MRFLVRARRAAAPAKAKSPHQRTREFDRAVAEFFMRLALAEAEKGRGRTSPNPVVGAVLVKGGRVIARGHHARAGGPHAEALALERAGGRARGADLYVTLEPCNHHGRTPPCTEAVLRAGVRRIFVGAIDRNPLVSGRGVRRLRNAGVEVVTGVLRDACERANAEFFKFITTGRPFVVLKAAATADGKIATASGDSRWVTGPEARALVQKWRDRFDAVLVGSGTVTADDPRLTARVRSGGRPPRDPVRVVLCSRLRLPVRARVVRERSSAPTWVATTPAFSRPRSAELQRRGVEVLVCRARRGRVDLEDLLARLAQRNIMSVLVEGGATVFSSFLERGLADELRLFIAPKVLGSGLSWAGGRTAARGPRRMADALRLDDVRVERVGEDVLLTARPARMRA